MRKLAFIFMLLWGVAFAAEVPVKDSVYTEDKQGIIVSAEQSQFTIKLKSNPTTGYSWFLRTYDKSLLTAVKHSFEVGDKKLIGAPGFEVWTFRAKSGSFLIPQQTMLKFSYSRPWEGADQAKMMVFKVSFIPKEK